MALLALILWSAAGAVLRAAELHVTNSPPQGAGPGNVPIVELRGRVVCLAEEMQRDHKAELPTRHEHLWGFKSTDGGYYTLLRGRFSEAIWLDDRVRAKELLINVRLFPKSHVIEVQNIKSVRNGVVQDLYYYCDICAIKAVSPEPCACCQGPVELVEKPLAGAPEE